MPPRVIRPKDESKNADHSERAIVKQSGKRRAVPSACIPCRKRKSKCDGGLPACSTCVAVYRTDCSYDAEVDGRPKSTAQRDVQALQQRNDALDVIVASLRALPEVEALSLLHSLRNTPSIDVVAASARCAAASPYSRSASNSDSAFSRPPEPSLAQLSPLEGHSDQSAAPSESPPVPSSATSQRADNPFRSRHASIPILQDPDTVRHIVDVYFAWVHPFNHLLSKDLFLADMNNDASNHFSTLLLYAILAFACHYIDRVDVLGEQVPVAPLSDYCFRQAEALLSSADKSHITTAQALGIMGLRESSRGRDSRAYQYVGRCLRTVSELNLHVAKSATTLSPAEAEARKITLWGAYTIETICATHAGRIPQLSRSMIDLPKPTSIDSAEMQDWQAYGHDFASSPQYHQPSQLVSFANCLSSLCELSNDILEILYSPMQSFTSRSLISAYEKYMNWYSNMPKAFWLDTASSPHVIMLHVFFNMCILGLFRPYIKLDLRGAGLFPRETCTQSANEISRMLSLLRDSHGLRRVPMITVNALITASTVHVLNLPSDLATAHLRQAMEDLNTLATNHQSAINGINVVQSLASRWCVRLPKEVLPLPTSPNTTRSTSRPQPSSAPSSYISDPYGVLYDNLGGTDDMPWPSPAVSQPYGTDGIMAVSQAGMTNDWHQQSAQLSVSQQESDQPSTNSMSWQWTQ